MKNTLSTLACVALLSLPLSSNAQELPQLSPPGYVSQRIGLTDVSVSYSRPSTRGRRVFGDLIKSGTVWRTGANHCTVLTTSGVLVVGGQSVKPGSYSLFTVPGEGSWQLILNADTSLWGAFNRDQAKDILVVKMPQRFGPPTETFTISFENLGQDKADLTFRWEKSEASISLEAPSDEVALKNIHAALADPKADFRVFARSADFCAERGVEPKEAVQWAEKSVSMEKHYWNQFTLAKAKAAVGLYKEAVDSGMEAVALARKENDESSARSYEQKVAEWTAKAQGK